MWGCISEDCGSSAVQDWEECVHIYLYWCTKRIHCTTINATSLAFKSILRTNNWMLPCTHKCIYDSSESDYDKLDLTCETKWHGQSFLMPILKFLWMYECIEELIRAWEWNVKPFMINRYEGNCRLFRNIRAKKSYYKLSLTFCISYMYIFFIFFCSPEWPVQY